MWDDNILINGPVPLDLYTEYFVVFQESTQLFWKQFCRSN
jgi:hypothetical protein